ncbi:hypothetical protein RBSWK_01652 [Rhodopirellula baltica SWK14]|uniref:Uncharacterized protein n=1 Tax=Rhodopirellula baltica SWK14 TaxID=993516 RepID=L7CJR3_RHOBT|nr:hypothetical protein RBSWK_01652 [Rhodopirellula baltica SWK14]
MPQVCKHFSGASRFPATMRNDRSATAVVRDQVVQSREVCHAAVNGQGGAPFASFGGVFTHVRSSRGHSTTPTKRFTP